MFRLREQLEGRFGKFDIAVLRYGLSSGVGLVVNVLLLVVFVEAVGLPASLAPVASLAVALTVTLVLVDRWVFPRFGVDDLRSAAERGSAYYLTMGAGKLVNYVIYLVLTAVGVPYPLAWVVGTGIVFAGTFLANRRIWRWSGAPD